MDTGKPAKPIFSKLIKQKHKDTSHANATRHTSSRKRHKPASQAHVTTPRHTHTSQARVTRPRPRHTTRRPYLDDTDGLHDQFNTSRRVLHRLDQRDVVGRQRVESAQSRLQDRHRLGQVGVTLVCGTVSIRVSVLDQRLGLHYYEYPYIVDGLNSWATNMFIIMLLTTKGSSGQRRLVYLTTPNKIPLVEIHEVGQGHQASYESLPDEATSNYVSTAFLTRIKLPSK